MKGSVVEYPSQICVTNYFMQKSEGFFKLYSPCFDLHLLMLV